MSKNPGEDPGAGADRRSRREEPLAHPGAPSPCPLLRTLPREGCLPWALLSSPTASVWESWFV